MLAVGALLVAVGLAGAVAGCDRAGQKAEAEAPTPSGGSAGEATGAADRAPGDDDRFATAVEPGMVSAGEQSEVTFKVLAGSGLKPNEEYPAWDFDLQPPAGVNLATGSFDRETVELTGDGAVFRTTLKAEEAGEVTIPAVGNFSMCNDSTCHIMRDQKLAFTVRVGAGGAESAGESGAE